MFTYVRGTQRGLPRRNVVEILKESLDEFLKVLRKKPARNSRGKPGEIPGGIVECTVEGLLEKKNWKRTPGETSVKKYVK